MQTEPRKWSQWRIQTEKRQESNRRNDSCLVAAMVKLSLIKAIALSPMANAYVFSS